METVHALKQGDPAYLKKGRGSFLVEGVQVGVALVAPWGRGEGGSLLEDLGFPTVVGDVALGACGEAPWAYCGVGEVPLDVAVPDCACVEVVGDHEVGVGEEVDLGVVGGVHLAQVPSYWELVEE